MQIYREIRLSCDFLNVFEVSVSVLTHKYWAIYMQLSRCKYYEYYVYFSVLPYHFVFAPEIQKTELLAFIKDTWDSKKYPRLRIFFFLLITRLQCGLFSLGSQLKQCNPRIQNSVPLQQVHKIMQNFVIRHCMKGRYNLKDLKGRYNRGHF